MPYLLGIKYITVKDEAEIADMGFNVTTLTPLDYNDTVLQISRIAINTATNYTGDFHILCFKKENEQLYAFVVCHMLDENKISWKDMKVLSPNVSLN